MNKPALKIGYIALTDALPLIAAQELGLFTAQGINVELRAEVSWSNIRDKLNIGLFDAAHMLAPMLFATHLGLSGVKNPLLTAFSFGFNGNAITVSTALYKLLKESYAARTSAAPAQALAEIITKRAARGLPPLTFATVYPFSCHLYQLRDWMESAGINTQEQVKLCILPPEQMVEHLRNKLIDGFCVGEPWNSDAVAGGLGHIITTGVEIWGDAPEKVLAVTESWATHHNDEHACLVRALTLAAEWVEYHRQDAVDMLIRSNIVQVAPHVMAQSLVHGVISGLENTLLPATQMHIFHRNQANIPHQHHALFVLNKMQNMGQMDIGGNVQQIAESCYKTEWHCNFINGIAVS